MLWRVHTQYLQTGGHCVRGYLFLCVGHINSLLWQDRVYMFHPVENTYLIIATLDVQQLLINRVKIRHVQCHKQHKQAEPLASSLNLHFYLLVNQIEYGSWLHLSEQGKALSTASLGGHLSACPGGMPEPLGASRRTISFPFPNARLKWYLFWKAELVPHLETFCSWIHKLCRLAFVGLEAKYKVREPEAVKNPFRSSWKKSVISQ